MRKIILLTILIYTFCGCGYIKMNETKKSLNKAYTGITIEEFTKEFPGAILIEMEKNFACYKLRNTSYKFGGNNVLIRFFYFKDNKLYRVDEGERATDLKIEIKNN